MGREMKRVPMDFNWPINMTWKGYLNPYAVQPCKVCDCSGLNPETKQISDDWYGFNGRSEHRWVHRLTQDEVDALIADGRLWDLTHTWSEEKGKVPNPPDSPPVTAEIVNEWSKRGFGHDGINQHICVKVRAKRLGVYGDCPFCAGEGYIFFNERIQQSHNDWYDKERYDPPEGEGYQLWETVSDGSPISPVFPTSEEMISHLIEKGSSEAAARNFVEEEGCAPSMILMDGAIYNDIEAFALKDNP